MKGFLLVLFLLVCILSGNAQVLDKKVHDFGRVENWNSQPAIFTLTNNTKQKIVFLPVYPSRDVLVQLPAKPIDPGETGEVVIGYFTPDKGPFNRKVQVYINISDLPIEFVLKGDILSIAPSAFTSCPTIAPTKNGKDKMPEQDILVVDKTNQQPIYGAQLVMGRDEITEINTATNRMGLITIKRYSGHYHVTVKKEGYTPLDGEMILSPEIGRIKLEMVPINLPPIATTEPIKHSIPPTTVDTTPYEDVSGIPDRDSSGLLSKKKYGANNVVFLIDVSNSMKTPNKLPLLKESLKQLVAVLRDIDKVTVIAYSNRTKTIVPTTSASDKEHIVSLIDSLSAGGGTNGLQGLESAYISITQNYLDNGNNQVILATDGIFNGPNDKNEQGVIKYVGDKSIEGVTLSVIGFGNEPTALKLMEKLASSGKGSFMHFTKDIDAGTLLVNEIKSRSKLAHKRY